MKSKKEGSCGKDVGCCGEKCNGKKCCKDGGNCSCKSKFLKKVKKG